MNIKTTGIEETVKELENLGKNSDEVMESVVKAGIDEVTDTMRAKINALKTSEEKTAKNKKRYPTKKEVQGLKDSLGFAPVKWKDTKANSKAGFDGYNGVKTKKYPNGHANQMMANTINKGNSFMYAQPFINQTKRESENKAIKAMQKRLDEEIEKRV